MAGSFNKVILMGNLTRDIELRYTPNNTAVGNFGVAVNRQWKTPDGQTQEEVDHFWGRLSAGGPVEAQQCGWLKDKFGVSWQVVHVGFLQMLQDPDTRKSQRAMQAMFQMKKLDVAALQRAFDGQS